MKGMVIIWALLLLLLLPLAAGQGGVSVYTIPGNISVNSSFLWVAEVPNSGEDTRVSWVVIGLVESGALGSFERLGDKWFCDFERTCGLNPFPMAGVYDSNIYITLKGGVLIKEQVITVSELRLDPHIYVAGNEVLVQVNVPGYSGSAVLRYSLYDANTLAAVQIDGGPAYNKNLAYCNCPAGFYNTSLSLEDGRYYLSFEAVTTDSKAGGSLHYFAIGEELQPLSVSLDKGEYWLGEKVRISGTTTFSSARAEIKMGGASKKNITFSLFSRGEYSEFSYDYLPKETGSYQVEVTAGVGNDSVTQTPGFAVSRLLEVSIPDIYINESYEERNFTLRNLVNQTLNITVSPGDELEGYVTAGLGKGSLGFRESTVLTLDIGNVLNSLEGKLVFRTDVADVEETVRVFVERPREKKPQIGIEPLSWSPEEGYLLGEPASKTFTVENRGTGTLGSFDYSLSGIDSDLVEVSPPGSIAMIPDEGEMEVSIDPPYSGRYRGVLRMTSNGGSQDVLIDLEFFDDISNGIDNLELEVQAVMSELTGRGTELPYAVSELASSLTEVRTSLEAGNYARANREFEKIEGKWEGVKSMVALLPEPGMDLSLVLVVVVIVIAAAGGFFFMKKRGRGGGEKKGEEAGEPEELEEEMY